MLTQPYIGLCHDTVFDVQYRWTGETSENSNKYLFRGFSKSFIHFDVTIQQWKLSLYSTNETFAVCQNSHCGEYPLGLREWTMTNDECNQDKVETVRLNFNACSRDEFNCLDGTW